MNADDVLSLDARGYVLLPGSVLVPGAEETYIRGIRKSCIFNEDGRNDRRRLQGKLRPSRVPSLMGQVRAAVRVCRPGLRACDAVAIRSAPGCRRQSAHVDYLPEATDGLSDADMPCGAIVALETSGTRLVLWPGSHRPWARGARAEEVHMSRGDMLVFRGDVVHAGAAYPDGDNTRVHVYLDSDAAARQPSRTFRLAIHGDADMRARILDEWC